MQSIELKEFQIEAVNKLLDATSVGKKKEVLVQAPTGERVIIVMGAVNVMKPRVSGTLNKYILCIA